MQNEYVDRILKLAKKSYDNNEIPVGAIVVKNNQIIGEGINSRKNNLSVIGHAEINAIEAACKKIGDWRLDGCVMYITLSPCMMCTGTIIESRIDKVFYLCDRTNVCFDPSNFIDIEKLNIDDMENEYLRLLQLFFENMRN